ncbi:MAG: formate dehydrogenase accessory sulfurtransferase FdhD [Gemmatimonadales bacterium]
MDTGALVDEVPVWLELNGKPLVTWMCTPEKLEELVVGWLHGEGFIESVAHITKLRPCATDLGFWVDIDQARVGQVEAEGRRPVLASGCGAVATYLASPSSIEITPLRGESPGRETFRVLFKDLFARGEHYKSTGGIHAAALVTPDELLYYAEDIGRHNAVDKVIGAALLDDKRVAGLGMLVTGRISAELAFKAARAGIVFVATPSVPSSLAAQIAGRAGMTLVGRAVSGTPHVHLPPNVAARA